MVDKDDLYNNKIRIMANLPQTITVQRLYYGYHWDQ